MAKKLYIGGVSYSTTNDSLKAAFAQAGNVESATIIMDKMTGRSKGFGFVEMATEEEAQAAIAMWNGKELDGRMIRVDEAKPMTDRPARGNDRGGWNH
jgi:RNA recognition motif-containing protein